jgi:hypothetical protein
LGYYNFLLKKTFKNRGNLAPLLILLLAIVGLYILNNTTGELYSYKNVMKDHYNQTKDLEEYYLELLNGETKYSDKELQEFEEASQDISEQTLWYEEILELAEEEKWSEALGYSINILNRHIEVNEKAGGSLFPSDYILALKQDIKLYEQLKVLEQEPDTMGYEKFGFNYVFRVMDSIFPIFFVLIVSVLLTEIFLNSCKKGINIETLLPMSFPSIITKKILYSSLLAVAIYLFTLLISFVLASIINGPGNILYPIIMFTTELPETMPIWIVTIKMLTLQVLSIFNIVLLISLISFFIKNNLVTLLVSIVLVIGSSMTLKSIEAFHSIAHLNPFTYISSGDVVTGFITQDTRNIHITFENGTILVCIFSIVLFTLNMIFAYQKEKKTMYV